MFKQVTAAYGVLFDKQKRAAYDRGGHAGLEGEAKKEAVEKERASFLAWAESYFDERHPRGLYKTLTRHLDEFGDYNDFIKEDFIVARGMIERIPNAERKAYMDKRDAVLSRVLSERQRKAAGAGARAGRDPGRGGDAGERAHREYAERKRTFDAMFDGWMTDANEGSLFKETISFLERGYTFSQAVRSSSDHFEEEINAFLGVEFLSLIERVKYKERMNAAFNRAKDAYEIKQARGGGAGAGAGGDAGGARERAERERVEKERQRQAFERIMEDLLSEKSPVGFYAEALKGFRDGRTFRSVKISSEARFETEIRDYRSVVSSTEQIVYKQKIEGAINRAERFYQDEREARDRAYREAEGKNLKDFTARFDQWMTKTNPNSLFVKNWGKLKTEVPLADVITSIRAELADSFAKQRIPFPLRASFEQRVEAAILELQRDFQADQGKERKRVEFRGRADQFIRENPAYIERNLGHISPDEDTKALVAQLKVLSLKVLNEMIAEYPEITPQEAQGYRTALEKSIDESAAAFEKKRSKDKGREAFEAWLGGVEEAAYQAFKGGEAYSKVIKRIGEEAKARTAGAPADRQERYVKKAEDAVNKAFLRNEKEKRVEYEKWSKPWFDGLRAACEMGLDNGVAPDKVKEELRKMLDAKVSILPREDDRKAEVRRMETTVDAVIEQWKKKPGNEKGVGEKKRAEKAAAEAWLSGAEAKDKIYSVLKSGMSKDETETIVRVILRNKMTSLSEVDQKPYLDRLMTLMATEHARYEQDKKRAEFEGWVRPWLAHLAGSCRSWLEGRKFEGGNWVPLHQKYDPDKVRGHVQKTLAEKLVLIPKGEHAAYTEKVDEIIAAAITLDAWKRNLHKLCQPMLIEGKPFSEIRKDIEGKLVQMLTMVSANQHAAYRKGVDEALARLEELYKENKKRKDDMNDFLRNAFGDGKK